MGLLAMIQCTQPPTSTPLMRGRYFRFARGFITQNEPRGYHDTDLTPHSHANQPIFVIANHPGPYASAACDPSSHIMHMGQANIMHMGQAIPGQLCFLLIRFNQG